MKSFVVLFLFLLTTCAQNVRIDDGTVNVVVSFYPLEEFAKSVGGEKVSVKSLIPAGVEPHEWEPSPMDVAAVQNADVFVYNGAGLEPWVKRLLYVVDSKKTVVVEASDGIELVRFEGGNVVDPHVWLDPLRAAVQVDNIKNGLIKADVAGGEFYNFNAKKLVEQLQDIHKKFASVLSSCAEKKFVASHDAFGYVARRYNLVQIPIAGLSPEEEPTPRHIAKLIKLVKENNIRTIFVETLVHPKVVAALARDTGVKTETLNPFEGLSDVELASGANYFSVMEQNLNKLKDALGCV